MTDRSTGSASELSASARLVLDELVAELDVDAERVRTLGVVERAGAGLARLRTDLEQQLERVEQAAVITLVGATGAGKSTLLNALVGRPVANAGEARPTTRAPVVFRPRDAEVGGLLEGLPGAAPRVVDYDPAAAGPWSEQILVDAPDVNSVAAEHRDVVAALAERSDVLVVVAHRQSVAELASASFVDAFAGRRGLLFVLGHADELDPKARQELRAQFTELARERWGVDQPQVFVTSARGALSDPTTEGWPELLAALGELVRGGLLGRVRRHNALGTTAALAARYSALGASVRPALETYKAELGAGLESWRGRVLEAVERRLAPRGADLTAQLWNEVARRWDGPGGVALRAGGLATLGLGAGALIARRNPLVAAGAAAGALAMDKARGALRERAIADAAPLMPGAGELADVEAECLGGARLAARGLGAGLQPPTADDLAMSAAAAVGEGWEELLEADLPATAERALPRVVRWAVDLPVYAFGGWVVWQAARGFWSGQYLGLDFLVNALLLLLAWLFLTRVAVRAWLGGRARAALARTRADVGRRLERAIARLGEPQLERSAELWDALGRLGGLEGSWRSRLLESRE